MPSGEESLNVSAEEMFFIYTYFTINQRLSFTKLFDLNLIYVSRE